MAQEIKYSLDTAGGFRLFNFATGSYNCSCVYCKAKFIGDKRAVQCLACAIKQAEADHATDNTASAKIAAELVVIAVAVEAAGDVKIAERILELSRQLRT